MHSDIQAYNQSQSGEDAAICKLLGKLINDNLQGSTNKVWHGHPVWFIAENPIVGYAKRKHSVQLLFWSGQSFDEPGLEPEGTFKASQANYTAADQINIEDIQRWLQKSQTIQWDYKNIVKRRGELIRL